jgi:YegS/Rv2252/BmrU family lipid kinase
VSGGGSYSAFAEYAHQLYEFLGYEVRLWRTESAGHATELAHRAADQGATLVIVCSGDGGVRETVAGLVSVPAERRPKLSVIPKGTANVLAKTLGLQLGPFPDFIHACFKQLYWARTREIDVGYLNDQAFACFAGFGFDATLIENVPPQDKRLFRSWAFLASGLRTFFGWDPDQLRFQPYEPPKMQVRAVDSEGQMVDTHAYFVAVGNVRDYGSRLFPFMQNARLDDGLLDVILVKTRDRMELLNIGTQVVARTHLRNPNVMAFQTREEITVEAQDAPVPMHVDCELLDRARQSRIRIEPRALVVVH